MEEIGKITNDKTKNKDEKGLKSLKILWNKKSGCKDYYTDTGFGGLKTLLRHVQNNHMWMD